MNWLRKLLPSNSLPIEQEPEVQGDIRNSLIARDFDVIEEFEHAEMQPQKKQRIMDEQSIVVYDQQQGSSSNSQLICQLDMLPCSSTLSLKIESLKEKLGCLSARQADILTELKDAEFQPGKKQREEVRHWLTEVQKIKNKIQSMRNDGQGSSSHSNLSGSIESFIKEVDELIQRSKFPNGLVLLDQESTRLPLMLDIKPVGTKFQQNTEKILGWLQNHEQCIIGVYGMGGVGKTTLLTHIHDQLLKDSELSQVIGCVYWVTVSQNCPVHKLQKDIAKALGLKDIKEDDERKRAAVLRNRLAARGRTVLILDDMWEQVSASKVGIPIENSNCKIILSTRSSEVCRKMGCKDLVIRAETLNEGEAWNLFVEKLGHYDTLEEEAKKIASDIAEECGGLPLAIAAMARSMTDVFDINEWKIALDDLKSARDPADMKEDVFRILQYSYDRLNDKRVQACFLSCLLYEEDAKIQRQTLIDLWINEGLLDDIKSRDAQVLKGHTILNKLESSCLLESVLDSDKEKCVKMHDLIRDMGIIITKENPFFIAEPGKQLEEVHEVGKWTKDLVKVSLSHNLIAEIPSGMAPMTPNLTVLMLSYNPLEVIPDSFFVHMKALTVLDLSGTEIERVPKSVSDLENLRALMLAHCNELIYVPSVAKLTKLTILDLYGSHKLKEAPRGLERLTFVEKITYCPWDASDMIGFNKVIQYLISYRFWIRDLRFSESDDDWFTFDGCEKSVHITGLDFEEVKSSWLLPTTLKYLGVSTCDMKGRCLGDVFLSLGEATGLECVVITDCIGLESISGLLETQQEGSTVSFSKSEVVDLVLRQLPDLRSITKSLVVIPKLRRLELSDVPKIEVIFPFAEQHQLPDLSEIKIKECEEMVEIFGSNKAILSGPIVSLSLSLPKLEDLYLEDLPKIKVIFPFTEELHLPNLKSITVSCCEEVEEIFESNKAHSKPILSLPKLNYLQIRDLPKLGSIYRGRLRCTSLVNPGNLIINGCPKLKWWRFPGGHLISDEPSSSSTMLEFPPETHLPNPDYDNKIQWGASLSLSLPFHNHQSSTPIN